MRHYAAAGRGRVVLERRVLRWASYRQIARVKRLGGFSLYRELGW